MENQTPFDLESAIQRWRKELTHSKAFRDNDLDELEEHLRDALAALQAPGLSPAETFLIASKRIGTCSTLASEFGKVNSSTAWLNRPWVGGLLQILTPGLGNLYGGRPVRGLILHIAVLGSVLLLSPALWWLPRPLNLVIPAAAATVAASLVILDGVRCARTASSSMQSARYNRWYVYLLVVAGVAAPEHFIVGSPARAHVVASPSMEPGLLTGDRVVVDRAAYLFAQPQRGDLAIYRTTRLPQMELMKRIVGMPGETIEIRNREVFVNGKKIDEAYVQFVRPSDNSRFAEDSLVPTVIPADTYFLLGDNRDNSLDSRFVGPVHRQQLLGKARTIYFSEDPDTHKPRWDRIGMTPN